MDKNRNRSGESRYRQIHVTVSTSQGTATVNVVARSHRGGVNSDRNVFRGRFDTPLEGGDVEELLALAALALERAVDAQ